MSARGGGVLEPAVGRRWSPSWGRARGPGPPGSNPAQGARPSTHAHGDQPAPSASCRHPAEPAEPASRRRAQVLPAPLLQPGCYQPRVPPAPGATSSRCHQLQVPPAQVLPAPWHQLRVFQLLTCPAHRSSGILLQLLSGPDSRRAADHRARYLYGARTSPAPSQVSGWGPRSNPGLRRPGSLPPPPGPYRRFRSTPKMLAGSLARRGCSRTGGGHLAHLDQVVGVHAVLRGRGAPRGLGAGAGADGPGGGIGFSASACWSFAVSRS